MKQCTTDILRLTKVLKRVFVLSMYIYLCNKNTVSAQSLILSLLTTVTFISILREIFVHIFKHTMYVRGNRDLDKTKPSHHTVNDHITYVPNYLLDFEMKRYCLVDFCKWLGVLCIIINILIRKVFFLKIGKYCKSRSTNRKLKCLKICTIIT